MRKFFDCKYRVGCNVEGLIYFKTVSVVLKCLDKQLIINDHILPLLENDYILSLEDMIRVILHT